VGKRGFPPKPTRLKLIEGNPGKRRLNRREPQPRSGAPTRPEWLLPEAKREWRRMVAWLEPQGLLTVADRAALSAYCQCWAMYVRGMEDIERNGTDFVTDKGYQGVRPAVTIATKMLEQMNRLGAKFGYTPSDRQSLNVPEKNPEDELDALLSG